MAFGWLITAVFEIVQDQIALLPAPPPTRAEIAIDRPRAEAEWAKVYPQLAAQVLQPPAPEFGEVWATRTMRICGLVNTREAAVDRMTRFYTVDGVPLVQDANLYRYIRVWTECINDRWIELHVGTEKTGFCASKHGRDSVLGRRLCTNWTE